MIKSLKKSLRLKNKRLLTELELKGHADTEPSVSADFKTLLHYFNYFGLFKSCFDTKFSK